jgi:hypothetical protein
VKFRDITANRAASICGSDEFNLGEEAEDLDFDRAGNMRTSNMEMKSRENPM